MKRIVIIGAGPTGLASAYRLEELGHKDFVVYERNSYPGGLSASFRDREGFTWDLGGHVIFSNHEYFKTLLKTALNNDFLEHIRKTWIFTLGQWIPYPFQNNIRCLPKGIITECLEGLRAVKKNVKSDNFEEWIINNMGQGIAQYFMIPYNLKVWSFPLKTLSTDWFSERISRVNYEEVVKKMMSNPEETDWGPNAVFWYPFCGGTGEPFRKISMSLGRRIEYNSEVKRIDPKQRKIFLSNGREDTYDILINTSPLDKFLETMSGCGRDLLDASLNLKHNKVFVVGLGIGRHCSSDKCWAYFPDGNVPFYRVTYLSNYSSCNVPDKESCYSLLCETSYSDYKKDNKKDIIERTIQGVINAGLLPECDRRFIQSVFFYDIEYAYPIPTTDRDRSLERIQPALEKMGIYSRGRFGAWKYELGNMDHSVMQGKEIIDRIFDVGEEFLWCP